MSGRLSSSAFRLGLRALRRLPAGMAYGLVEPTARLMVRRDKGGVPRLRANLDRAVAPGHGLEALTRAGMASYLRYWVECVRLQDWTPEMIDGSVRAVGTEPVLAELEAGRGVVCGLAHQGNWDLAGAWGCRNLAPVTTVAERLEPAELFQAFLEFREGLGMTVLALGDEGVFRDLYRAVKVGALVPLLMDRDLTGTGVPVDLFEREASFAGGPAALAEATGALLFPVSISYEQAPVNLRTGPESGYRTVITFHPAVPPSTAEQRGDRIAERTQACADALAAGIAAAPQDWHMLQRVFVEDLDPGRRSHHRGLGPEPEDEAAGGRSRLARAVGTTRGHRPDRNLRRAASAEHQHTGDVHVEDRPEPTSRTGADP